MSQRTSRRTFVRQSAAASVALASTGFWTSRAAAESKSPDEKLHIGIVGAGGQGASNLQNVKSENVVALCDVDERRAADSFQKFPQAARYRDFRKMLDERKDLDAVVISTPDHCHAAASVMAMKLGKHVYCEKPLAHSVYETRVMRQVAAETKVATQMGTQGSSHAGLRRAVELVKSGTIGAVREIHAWSDRPIWPQGIERPADHPPVPDRLDWDLWLGPAPARAYHPAYLPFVWRGWWDFGTGALGDMACHVLNMAFLALDLGAPISVEAESSPIHRETAPLWSIIRYEFPARGKAGTTGRGLLPPLSLTWYDGGKKPPAELVGAPLTANGSLLVGDSGKLYTLDDFGSTFKLLPEEKFADLQPAVQPMPEVAHHREWIAACKTGSATLANFDFAAGLSETVLLGNVALRVGQKINWDSEHLRATNCPAADALVQREYRAGWTL
jgi:predicted dehydrogenase